MSAYDELNSDDIKHMAAGGRVTIRDDDDVRVEMSIRRDGMPVLDNLLKITLPALLQAPAETEDRQSRQPRLRR